MTDSKEIVEEKKLSPIQEKWQEAQYLAQSSLLPKHFTGQPANVLIALEYAKQLSTANKQLSPISVMQNLYVVHGNCGLSSKFKIALANSSGKFDSQIKYKTAYKDGKVFCVKAYTTIGGEEVSHDIDMDTANAEGWTKNPKYKSLPQLMLSYRAASSLINLYAPEVTMGLTTDDDIMDAEYSETTVVETEKPKALASGDIIDDDLL